MKRLDDAMILTLDDDPIRMTPDGKVAVTDAIRAVSKSSAPEKLWKAIIQDHPEILDHCDQHYFDDESRLVIDTAGWEQIWHLLPDYLWQPAS